MRKATATPASIQTDSFGLASVLSKFSRVKSNTDAGGGSTRLTDSEIENIFRSSNLVQKIIKKYPFEAKAIGYQLEDEKGRIVEYNDEQLLLAFQEASIYSRLYGRAFLYLNLDDRADDLPVRIGAKLQGWTVYFDIAREGDYYLVNDGYIVNKIHFHRIIEFIGARTYAKFAKKSDDTYCESVLQGIVNSLDDYLQSNKDAKHILSNLSYLSIGIDNLGNMTRTDEGKKSIFERLTTLNLNRSINRALAFDKKSETIGFITQSTLVVPEIIGEIEQFFVAETDYPYEELFEQSIQTRFGSSGIQNQLIARYLWARRCRNWVINNWLPYYTTYFNRVRKMQGIKINIPFIVDLTQLEQVEIERMASERTKNLIDAGVITRDEARGGYRGSKFTLNLELTDEAREVELSSLIVETLPPKNDRM